MDTIPQTVEIVMTLTTWAVSFNCPANCANNFNGWQCQINGEILNSGETTYLTNGSWTLTSAGLVAGGVMGQIIVNNAPVNIGFLPVDNPEATFHVQSQTGNLRELQLRMILFH